MWMTILWVHFDQSLSLRGADDRPETSGFLKWQGRVEFAPDRNVDWIPGIFVDEYDLQKGIHLHINRKLFQKIKYTLQWFV